MFICDKNNKCCYYQFWDTREDIDDDEAMECEHLVEVRDIFRWIPTRDRLPKVHEEVLITVRYEDIEYVEIGYLQSDLRFYNLVGDICQSLKQVTAWMPLPDPHVCNS